MNGTHVNALGQCPGVIVPPLWYLDFLATGTGPCLLPDGNCSHYEFTITGRQRFGQGSLNLRITLPPGSVFPEARVTRGSRYCPASAWSCSKSGDGFTCSAEDCGLAPGDQVVVRTEGRVVPELTAPPPAPIDKTACAVLDWQALPGPGPVVTEQLRDTGKVLPPPSRPVDGVGTDQFGRTSSKQACWTIQVIPRSPPAVPACPPNYVATPDGQCCLASQATTGGQCCPPGQKPDARRQRCVAITPVTPLLPGIIEPPRRPAVCERGFIRLSSGECCPRKQVTTGGQCCPPGQRPDSRRRNCVTVAPPPTVVVPGVIVAPKPQRICPARTYWNGRKCVPIRVYPTDRHRDDRRPKPPRPDFTRPRPPRSDLTRPRPSRGREQ